MNVLIKIQYSGWEVNTEQKGYFQVNAKKFKENNDLAVAEIALQWIREIMSEGYISRIIKVEYNGGNDITDIVNEKLNKIPEEGLWFLNFGE